MSTKVHHQPEFVGMSQFLLMLDFVRNPDTYESKLRELTNLRDEVNRGIDASIDLSKIEEMRREASEDKSLSKKMLAAATERCDELTRNAQHAADELLSEAERLADDQLTAAKLAATELINREEIELAKMVAAQEAAAEAQERAETLHRQAAKDVEAARAAEAHANASRQKYEQKYNALQGALKSSEG